MVSKSGWKEWLILGAAVVLFVTTGGLLMASNLAFKINKPLCTGNIASTNIGVNWTSIPFNNPYVSFRGLCKRFIDQYGFTVAGAASVNLEQILVNTVNVNGSARNVNCFTCCGDATCTKNPADVNCNHTLVQDGAGGGLHAIRIRITGTGATSPASIVLAGSHNETQTTPPMLAPAVVGSNRNHNWISIPYHTTWLRASDVCASLGAVALSSAITISRIDCTGSTSAFSCGGSATLASNFVIVYGEGIRITKSNLTFPPPLPAGGLLIPHF